MHILILITGQSGDDSQQRDNANQTRERVILLIEFAQAKIPPHVASYGAAIYMALTGARTRSSQTKTKS
jgi:hypothetical protein